jgi:hypothetical protein
MNNKIKSISHRSFGFRSAGNFIAAIYHCCARLPLPVEGLITLFGWEPKIFILQFYSRGETFPGNLG